jgi:hypothetical protein
MLPSLAGFGEEYAVGTTTVLTGAVRFASGVLATVPFNSDAITNERVYFEVTGSTGVLTLENPDHFGGVVALQREGQATAIAVPSTFGLSTNLRGAGVAEMAWAIQAGRRPRASKELAFHVLEALLGLENSGREGRPCAMTSTVPKIPRCPTGMWAMRWSTTPRSLRRLASYLQELRDRSDAEGLVTRRSRSRPRSCRCARKPLVRRQSCPPPRGGSPCRCE